MSDTTATLRDRYLAAQLKGQRHEALRLLMEEGLEAGVSVPDLELQVIGPAQREMGRLWQENRITVAQEHLATAISQLALAQLYRHLPRDPPNGKRVTVSCVEGELHEVGARMASDFLEMSGFEVDFLGANVPTDHLVSYVRDGRPDLLCLSATLAFHVPALKEAVVRVRAQDPRLPIAVGGLAFEWSVGLQEQLGVTFYGRDARELVAGACRELGV
jgi:MerR family transcriptional regulator, light-induced transcriptional regulator